MGFFYEVRVGDEVASTHPSYAPNAARVGRDIAIAEEADATDFPRPVRVFEQHSITGARITRSREITDETLDRRADKRELELRANARLRARALALPR